VQSSDGGGTWSTPRTINKGPAVSSGADSTNNDNWQPAITVAPTSGQITVTFYDRREDPANVKIKLYRAVSSDGGATWFDQPASSTSFQPDTGYDPLLVSSYMGDYNFASHGTGSTTQATWGDERDSCAPPVGATNPCSPAGRPDMDVFTNSGVLLRGPDLFLTPWGYVTGIGPVWQTPDIFVVDSTGTQVNAEKGIVNLLRARVKNVGDVASSGATITFKYAPWFAGITPAALKTISTVAQDFTPGQSVLIPTNWDLTDLSDTNGGLWPAAIGTFDHFCVQVTVTLATDVNPGNNFAQNNFDDVATGFSQIREAAFLVGNPYEHQIEARLNLRLPDGYRATLRGVPANEAFPLAKNQIKLAVIHFEVPKLVRVPKTDQIAEVDFVVGGVPEGGLQLRLAKANHPPPRERLYEATVENVFRAIVRTLQQREEGPSFADQKKRLINTRQIRISAEALHRLVGAEPSKKVAPEGGFYVASFKIAPVTRPLAEGETARTTLGTAVSIETLLVAASPAYVQTGGVPLASNGALEQSYFEAIAHALAELK
jgi:hypothetical protein